MSAALVRLWLRRALPAPLLVGLVLLLALAATRGWVPDVASFPDPGEAARRADDFRRQALWLVFALVAVPALFVSAADVGNRWRRRDADWLGWQPVSRTRVIASAWLGVLIAAAILSATTTFVAEIATSRAPEAFRFVRTLKNDALALLPDERRKSARLEALPDGTRLRVEVTVAPGTGPVARVRASLGESAQEASVFGRHAFELEATGGARELVFERLEAGAALILPSRSLDVIEPVASQRFADWAIAWRVLVAVAAWSALALALGTWMRPALAAGLAASLALASTWLPGRSLVPGADLVETWQRIGTGLLPPTEPWTRAAGALGFGALGLLLARRGLAHGRSLPRW